MLKYNAICLEVIKRTIETKVPSKRFAVRYVFSALYPIFSDCIIDLESPPSQITCANETIINKIEYLPISDGPTIFAMRI